MNTVSSLQYECDLMEWFICRHKTTNLDDDVYSFGFILLESLIGPIVSGKGESFLLNEMVCYIFLNLKTLQLDDL